MVAPTGQGHIPAMIKRVPKRLIELITNTVRTILTVACGIIDDISGTAAFKEGRHVLAAGLARWRSKSVEFLGCTLYLAAVKLSHHHTTNETREGIKFIQPGPPETRNLRLWNCDTTEERESDDDEGVRKGRYEWGRRQAGDHLT